MSESNIKDDDVQLDAGDIMAGAEEYNSSEIQVLEGLEHVRLRPGLYIGTTGIDGLHNLVYEVLATTSTSISTTASTVRSARSRTMDVEFPPTSIPRSANLPLRSV